MRAAILVGHFVSHDALVEMCACDLLRYDFCGFYFLFRMLSKEPPAGGRFAPVPSAPNIINGKAIGAPKA